MKKLKHYLTACIGLILFVSVIALSLPQNGHSSVAADKDVRVVNTAAEPIPVAAQGTTSANAVSGGGRGKSGGKSGRRK